MTTITFWMHRVFSTLLRIFTKRNILALAMLLCVKVCSVSVWCVRVVAGAGVTDSSVSCTRPAACRTHGLQHCRHRLDNCSCSNIHYWLDIGSILPWQPAADWRKGQNVNHPLTLLYTWQLHSCDTLQPVCSTQHILQKRYNFPACHIVTSMQHPVSSVPATRRLLPDGKLTF